jgi:hypothetical protein
MIIHLPCALTSFSSTWSSCPSFYVHSFMILLIISCTKSCGLVAISLCHLLLHHVCYLCLIQTTWHNGISNLVSLITKTKLGLSAPGTKCIEQHLHGILWCVAVAYGAVEATAEIGDADAEVSMLSSRSGGLWTRAAAGSSGAPAMAARTPWGSPSAYVAAAARSTVGGWAI